MDRLEFKESLGKNMIVNYCLYSLFTLNQLEVFVAQLCLTLCDPWTVACQAPLSKGFSRKEYWRGLWCPPLEDLLDPGIEPWSPALQADSLPPEPPGKLKC